MPVNKMGKKTKKNDKIVQNRKKNCDKIPELGNINDPRKAWKDQIITRKVTLTKNKK